MTFRKGLYLSSLAVVMLAALAWCRSSLAIDEDALPRVEPMSPSEAMGSFQVVEGFHIEQVAAEPLVADPVAMAFDERGRLYVVEMRDYSEQDKERLGVVRLLTDSDGDGKFDKSTVFSQELSWPTAIACYDGGVFIGAAPDLYYCKDTDDDGVADQRELVCTGFGRSNVQGLLNSFQWGLDNRIYGATSVSNAKLTFPDRPDDVLELRGRDFAFDPRTRNFSAVTGGAQHGMSFNRWGDRFVCSNSDHLQAIVFEDRYLSRNPYQSAPAARRSIAADGPQAEVFRTSPVEAWRIARTKMRMEGRAEGSVEGGGRPAGYFTSATGITIYEGDLWPEKFRGWAIVADVGSNLIHRKRMAPDGVTYRGERVDQGSEFVTSTDIWFRPVQMAIGPEGALYVADMYREVIEHPQSLPPKLKTQIDLTSGRDRGRIYRIVPENHGQIVADSWVDATTAELVAALQHANQWTRTTAARLLYERQDAQAIPPLQDLAKNGSRPEARIAALYALDGLNATLPNDLSFAMDDKHPQVRRHAIRLSEPWLAESAALRDRVLRLVNDQDVIVRFQLALSLGEIAGPGKAAALAQLLARDSENSDVVGAAFSSMVDCAGPVLAALLARAEWIQSKAAGPIVSAIVEQIERQQRDQDLEILRNLITSAGEIELGDAAAWVLIALGRPDDAPITAKLAALRHAQRSRGKKLIEVAEDVLESDATPAAKRIAAIEALQLDDFEIQRERLSQLLTPEQPATVQAAVLELLAKQDSPAVAGVVLDGWQQFTPALRRQAIEVMSQREPWLLQLLAAIESEDVHRVDIEPTQWSVWRNHPSTDVRVSVEQLGENSVASDRSAIFHDYKTVLESAGDSKRGEEIFTKHCASCHQLGTTGHQLGPNLAAMVNRGAESILYNILVPNAEVESRYINYIVTTVQGRVLTGVVVSETAGSITLRGANNGAHDILRVDIDDMQSTGMSLMPDGFEQSIDKAAMADLLAFLNESSKNAPETQP